MSEFLMSCVDSQNITILGSGLFSEVISACLVFLFREWISSRLQQSIKHEYDAKLEGYKAGYEKILAENKVRFNWWHNEQANAIKDIYYDLAELSFCLHYLLTIELHEHWKKVKEESKNNVRSTLVSRLTIAIEQSAQKWLKLKLFLDDNEDSKVKSFRNKTELLFTIYFNSITNNSKEMLENDGDKVLAEINEIMEELRHRFQIILQGQEDSKMKKLP